MKFIFNFSAGPSMLPLEVLNQVENELRDWCNLKVSVMEVSHRSNEFGTIVQDLENDLRKLLNIPDFYKVLFCHGGARTQFSAIPMNLLGSNFVVDYVNSGYWSYSASREATKYCKPHLIDVNFLDDNNMRAIRKMKCWSLSSNSAYLHYCPNETVDGIAIHELPKFDKDIVVVGDLSSTLLSQPLDVNCFGVIYAAAQKNMGVPGLTVVIIREDLLYRSCKQTPSTLQYNTLIKHQSMFNTPVTFSWYIAGLIFKWIKNRGGLLEMSIRNKKKANLLYKAIDESDFYYNNVALANRSYMNVVFHLKDIRLNNIFLKESHAIGLYGLKGHRVVGGMRASLYNAMSLKGVRALVEFMQWFSRKYG